MEKEEEKKEEKEIRNANRLQTAYNTWADSVMFAAHYLPVPALNAILRDCSQCAEVESLSMRAPAAPPPPCDTHTKRSRIN